MHNWVRDLQICGVGAQLNLDMLGSNQRYQWAPDSRVPLMELTDQSFDPPSIHKLSAHKVLDEMPICVFVDFGVELS